MADELTGPDVRIYRLSATDYLRATRRVFVDCLLYPSSLALGAGFWGILAWLLLPAGAWLNLLLLVLFGVAILLGVAFWGVPRNIKGQLARQPALLGPIRVAVRPDGLHQQTEAFYSRHAWGGFMKFRSGRAFAYLYQGPNAALILPQACLTEDDRRRLAGFIQPRRGWARRPVGKTAIPAPSPGSESGLLEGPDVRHFVLGFAQRYPAALILANRAMLRSPILIAAIVAWSGWVAFVSSHKDWTRLALALGMMAGVWLAIMLAAIPLRVWLLLRDPRRRAPIRMAIRGDGVHMASGFGLTDYDWDLFNGYRRGRHIDLLYLTPITALILPAKALTEADRQMMAERVTERLRLRMGAAKAEGSFR